MSKARDMGIAPRTKSRIAITVASMTVIGVFLGVIGPFGSYLNGGVLPRIGYWVGSIWLGVLVFGALLALLLRWGLDRRLAIVATILIGNVPQAAITRPIALALWPILVFHGPSLLGWYAQGLVITTPIVLAYAAATGVFRAAPSGAELQAPEAGHPPILARLPAYLGREILCLAMEDHYVRVHTTKGSTLLLLPMARAIVEVAPLDGLRTHRSWWVARAAVKRAEGNARAMQLVLVDDRSVPVARSAIATLRGAGWLER